MVLVAVYEHPGKAERIALIVRVSHVLHVAAESRVRTAAPRADIAAGAQAVHPDGCRTHGDVEEDAEAVFRTEVHDRIEPGKVIFAVGRLEAVPAEVAEADHVEARFAHHGKVHGPAVSRPVVGVVVGADVELIFTEVHLNLLPLP